MCIVFISTRISVFESPIQHGSEVNHKINFDKKSTGKRTIGLNCTVASSSSATRRVLAEISIESHIEIPTNKGLICD